MLSIGLGDWGGPASCGDAMAQVLGFRDVDDLHKQGERISESIWRGETQTRRDWTRAFASLEVMLTDSLGSGEWGAIHGYVKEDLYAALGPLRRKLPIDRSYLRTWR